MLKGFREFILRGNVIDLAVGIVIGAAFTGVITSLVNGLITPLIAAIFGKPNLDSVGNFTINGAEFSIGVILTAVLNFVLVAAAIYFVVIVPINHLQKIRFRKTKHSDVPDDAPVPTELELLAEIRDLLASDRRDGKHADPVTPTPDPAT
jgi:large conductance mechanosensitive channel